MLVDVTHCEFVSSKLNNFAPPMDLVSGDAAATKQRNPNGTCSSNTPARARIIRVCNKLQQRDNISLTLMVDRQVNR